MAKTRHFLLNLAACVLVCHSTSAAATATIIVTNNLTFQSGQVISARLIVHASHIVIDGGGATLQGPGDIGDVTSLEKAGVGILVEGGVDVTIRNLKARGFANGLLSRDANAMVVENCDFSDNYHNPKHGWDELPPRGGILLERSRHCWFRNNHANRVWDAFHLVDSDDNTVEDNDFSHCSNTCAKLWHSSHNRFLRNNLSYGIRIDRAAGEVHARDSTSVLIESGSDENYWLRNDATQGGDGIFIRVLNGWVSRGNVFVENDTSYANNNCIESWSPGNTYIRNKANHGSYGFWLGGSDQTVLIGNEAGFNGQTNGNHNAPEPGFGHGGIVIVNGPCSHALLTGNWCHDNNGGGIVFRGDVKTQGARWRTCHWVIQQNRLENNRWPIWGRWADSIWIAGNIVAGNREESFLTNISNLTQLPASDDIRVAPKANLVGPSRAFAGEKIHFDGAASHDVAGRPLHFKWSVNNESSEGPVLEKTFQPPGFYRVGLTVDKGGLADIAWRDLLVTERGVKEVGSEVNADAWGSADAENTNRLEFRNDSDAAVGKNSIRFIPQNYRGEFVTAIYPKSRNADWDLTGAKAFRFWIKHQNPNLPGFQNAGPIVYLYSKSGSVKFEPAKGANLLSDPPFSEARWTWMQISIPVAGDSHWTKLADGDFDLRHVCAFGMSMDSWGDAPFTIWVDGITLD